MEERVTVRPCREDDLSRMREICAACDDPAHPERLSWVLPMYCDFYVSCCRDTCFVAVNAADQAIGYILCAPEDRAYRKAFMQSGALQTVRRASPMAALLWRLRPVLESRFHRPPHMAHLHIDIFEAYQRMGLGRRLMDALFSQLRQRGVPGVMLGCQAKNRNAQQFYGHMGFRKLGMVPGTVYYGLQL